MSTFRSQKNIILTLGATLRSQQLVPTIFATESRTSTHTAAPSKLLTGTQASIEYKQGLDPKHPECNIVVDEFLSRGKRAGEILCTHAHKQARSASLPCQTFDAPHVTLVTAADHQKKHVWRKQAANPIGKSHGI